MPILALTPNPAVVGATIRVDGVGFDSTKKVQIMLDGAGATTNYFRPAKDGTFHIGMNVSTTPKTQVVAARYAGTTAIVAQTNLVVTVVPPVVPPVVVPPTGYDAEFTASGNDDSGRLRDFIVTNRGKKVRINGVVKVSGGYATQWTIPAGAIPTTIDFAAGAKLQAITAKNPALVLSNAWDIVFNDLRVVGTGWDGSYYADRQWEAGVLVEGGGRLIFNKPDIRDTKGDGFNFDQHDANSPAPIAVVINNPVLFQNARNGITGNAGEVTVNGGTIDKSGLHNIDMEPNWDSAAKTINVTFNNMRLTNHGVLYVADAPGDPDITGFAVAGLGYSSARKIAIRIVSCSSDQFLMAVDRASTFVFTGNHSDSAVSACGPGPATHTVFAYGMGTYTVSNNDQICVNTTWDLRG